MKQQQLTVSDLKNAFRIETLSLFLLAFLFFFPLWKLIFSQISKLFNSPSKRLKYYNVTQFVNWAVITGASSGIGEAMAEELCSCGFSVLLIARKELQLKEICDKLNKAGGEKRGKAQYMICDVTDKVALSQTVKAIKQLFSGVDEDGNQNKNKLRILMNSVGIVQKVPDSFCDIKQSELEAIIETNIIANTIFMHELIPLIRKEKNGLIINMGSSMGKFPTPYLSLYCASKAYINSLSDTLKIELADSNIDIISACPWYVSTNMTMTKKTNLVFISPKHFVKTLLSEKLHDRCGSSLVDPYWVHSIMDFLFSKVIVSFQFRGQLFYGKMITTRKRIINKIQKSNN